MLCGRCGICCGSFIVFFESLTLRRNFRNINTTIKELGSENGDLTRKLDIHSGDELEILGSGLNKLLDRVQYIINNIAKGTDNINESMTSIGNVMSDAEAKVTLINDDMNNMVAATEEIAASTATAFNEVTEFCQGTEKIAELTEKIQNLQRKSIIFPEKLQNILMKQRLKHQTIMKL